MQRKSFKEMECPIARGLERVGEWWSILILREAFQGATRFEQFQKALDIAPTMLTRRLKALVESGILTRRRYTDSPPREEYLLTPLGKDFEPVLVSLFVWGNTHFTPEGRSMLLVDAETGAEADPQLIDRVSGRALSQAEFAFVPGPAASETMQRRLVASRRQTGLGASATDLPRARTARPARPRRGSAV